MGPITSHMDVFLHNCDPIEKMAFLAEVVGCDIKKVAYLGEHLFAQGKQKYLVCHSDEADELWDKKLLAHARKHILPFLPIRVRGSFNLKKWMVSIRRDNKNIGRAAFLDCRGREQIIRVGRSNIGENCLFIYRVNLV